MTVSEMIHESVGESQSAILRSLTTEQANQWLCDNGYTVAYCGNHVTLCFDGDIIGEVTL